METPAEKAKREAARLRRHARIRSAKRILRYLPRRAALHRYPILKWFPQLARKRDYLWSFRIRFVQKALFYGCIIAFLPIMGVQILIATLLALRVQANLPVIIALQWISNPGTVVPIYLAKYQLGSWLLAPFTDNRVEPEVANQLTDAATSSNGLIAFFQNKSWDQIGHVVGAMFLGGLVIGLIAAVISTVCFTTIARRAGQRE